MSASTTTPAKRSSQDSQDEIAQASLGTDTATPSVENLFENGVLDPVYYEKTLILNRAMQEIGMGRYQWQLFFVAGFGWFADSVWPLITGLILTPVINEFHFNAPFLSLAANAGLLVGAVFWGVGCDVWGRRWCFNVTLLIAGVFGLAAGGANNFITLASLLAVMGVGVGGNLPIDSAVFLDFVPASHQHLLTFMSIFWCLGQVFVNLVAWPLIANFSCPFDASGSAPSSCTRSENMGWRYLLFILGGITILLWGLRFFIFELFESPRYLIGKGEDARAVAVVHRVAKYNGMTSSLTVEQLTAVGGTISEMENDFKTAEMTMRVGLSRTSHYTAGHIKALFRTPKLAWATSLLISIWGTIGLASTLYNNFLPFLLASRGAHFGQSSLNITYRNTFILAVVGVPSAFLATYAVSIPGLGRRGSLALAAALTGVFLFLTTIARTSNALLGWNCGYSFFSNIMYGILYAISPEIFPAKDRGTGNGLTATASRVFGLIAPIIALYANLSTAVPVYISGALIIGAGALALLLPYEPRGRASMFEGLVLDTHVLTTTSWKDLELFRPFSLPMLLPACGARLERKILLRRDVVAANAYIIADPCQKAHWLEHKRVCKALKTLETQHAEELRKPFQLLGAFSGRGVGVTDLTNDCINGVTGVEMRVLCEQLERRPSYAEQNLVGWQPRCLACGRSHLVLRVEASSGSTTKPPALRACPDCLLAFACNDAHWDAVETKHKMRPCQDSIDNKSHCEMNQMVLQDLRLSQVVSGAEAGPFRWAPERTMAEWASLKGADWSDYEPFIRNELGGGMKAGGMLGAMLRAATEGLSMPLMVLWALEILNGEDISWTKKDVLNIHVLGAAAKETMNGNIFEEILHRLPEVKTLNLFFVGPELAAMTDIRPMITLMETCHDCSRKGRKRVHHYQPKPYHLFVKGAGFTDPDLAVAFNSGCSEEASSSWKETLKVLVARHVPTVFTSYNHDEAQADSRVLESAGATLVPELGPRKNTWASLLVKMEPNKIIGFYAINCWLAGGFR